MHHTYLSSPTSRCANAFNENVFSMMNLLGSSAKNEGEGTNELTQTAWQGVLGLVLIPKGLLSAKVSFCYKHRNTKSSDLAIETREE